MKKSMNKNTENNIEGFVKLPYEISSDEDFFPSLERCLKQYKQWVEFFLKKNEGLVRCLSEEKKKQITNAISFDCGVIKNCIKLYYSGDIALAVRRINRLLSRIIKEDSENFIKSEFDKSYGCRLVAYYPELHDKGFKNIYEKLSAAELTFFRARKSYFSDYHDMYHIPLDLRDAVGTERFSIPGVPCMYIGTSVYDIWLELERPAYSDFNVSAIKLTDDGKKMQILNMALTPYFFYGLIGITGEANAEKAASILKASLRIYPLIIATSIRNKKPRGKFRSDYIISHLIMMNLKSLHLDGVAYISKRIENGREDYSLPQLVNIALPAFEKAGKNKKYGTVCENIVITNPVNYEEFTNLELSDEEIRTSFFAKAFDKLSVYGDPTNDILISRKILDYRMTGFYKFENYLCGLDFHSLA